MGRPRGAVRRPLGSGERVSEEEDLGAPSRGGETEGLSFTPTPAFGRRLGKREGGKPDGKAGAAQGKGSGSASSCGPSASGSSASGGLLTWRRGEPSVSGPVLGSLPEIGELG